MNFPFQLPEWLIMLADEFKLVLGYVSTLETEAIKNRYELKILNGF